MSKRKKKKHTGRNILIFLVLVCAALAASYYFYTLQEEKKNQADTVNYKEETVKKGSVAVGITESGTVTLGSSEQDFSVADVIEVESTSSSSDSSTSSAQGSGQSTAGGMDMASMMGGASMESSSGSSSSSTGTETALEVEEVYVAVGQAVSEGDPILKITEDSIEEYRTALNAAVKSAQLLVQQEEINVETKQAEADYTYEMYLAQGETAEETYNATITSLENEVSDLEEELEEAQDDVDTYQSYVDSGYDYDDELEEAQLNYSTIEANLQIARNNLTTQSIEAKQTYENALTNYKYADQLYAIDTDGLEDDLNDARETLTEAQEALEEFEDEIGDGIIYSEYSGKILTVSYSAGDTITSDAAVATFSDADNITITVSVSQDDISSISTGDDASIALTAYEGETFTGTVNSIESSSSIGSSTVNYDVEVLFTEDTDKVYSGMTGDVTFTQQEVTDTLYISNRAVHLDGSRSWVKVKNEDGSIEEVDITTGFSNGSIVAVTEGLEEGQTVLIESQVTS